MSPKMQGMCIGVKSMPGSVAVCFYLYFFFLPFPRLASLGLSSVFQTAGMFKNVFLLFFLGGLQRDTGEHWLTAWKLANVHMHDNLIQISTKCMDLFRRDSTWLVERCVMRPLLYRGVNGRVCYCLECINNEEGWCRWYVDERQRSVFVCFYFGIPTDSVF